MDDTKFCYQLIITLTKFVIYILGSFFKLKHKKFQDIFASSEKKPFKLARDGAYCPVKLFNIKAEIGAVDSQSDSRIFL